MQHTIDYGPAYSMLTCNLEAGESIIAEGGAMVSMSPGLQIATTAGAAGGGVMGALKRSVLGGESFFMNTFTASHAAQVSFAPRAPGDIFHHPLDGAGGLMVVSGCYMASDGSVTVDTKWGGAKTFFSGAGLFLLHVTGGGNLYFSSFGAMRRVDLAEGQMFTVDTGHVIAFHDTMTYTVNKFGSWKSTILGGEGLVAQLTGPGSVWIQTRSAHGLAEMIIPFIPQLSN